MQDHDTPEGLSKKMFAITMSTLALYVAAVIVFVL
jgi:hypothetical protein